METEDVQLIKTHLREDKELASLYEEHLGFERRLAKLDNKLFLTPKEELLRKELQKKKLMGKDRLEDLLRKYRG